MKKTIIGLIAVIFCLLYGCGGEPECPLNYVSLARFEFVDSKTHVPVKTCECDLIWKNGLCWHNLSITR